MEHQVRPSRRWFAMLIVPLALGAAACSGGQDADSSSASDITAAPGFESVAPADTTAAAASEAAGGGFSAPDGAPATSTPGVYRAVIATAEMTVTVADVSSAAAKIRDAATAAGGYVASSEESASGDGSAVVTIKVPPGDFERLLDELGGLGTVERRQIDSQDVTDQMVDLDARVGVMKAGVQRLTELIAQTNNIGEIASLEAELTRRTADLESIEGQLRVLSSQVSLSTITVTVQPVVVVAPDPVELVGEVHATPSFVDGLRSGWDALSSAARATSVAVGAVLPWLIPTVLLLLVLWFVRRRMRSQPTGAPVP